MMRRNGHAQGNCPDATALRIVGDQSRTLYHLCAACKASYEGAPFSFTFVPADRPEWQMRAAEHRLPANVRNAA